MLAKKKKKSVRKKKVDSDAQIQGDDKNNQDNGAALIEKDLSNVTVKLNQKSNGVDKTSPPQSPNTFKKSLTKQVTPTKFGSNSLMQAIGKPRQTAILGG